MQVCHAGVSCTLLLFEQSESGLVFGQVFFSHSAHFPPYVTPHSSYISPDISLLYLV